MPKRPTSLSVCGILMIVFGAMELMSLVSSAMMMSGGMNNFPGAAQSPVLAAMMSPGYTAFMKMMILPTLAVALLGIIAGSNLLRGREWARKSGFVWVVLRLGIAFAAGWAATIYVTPAMGRMPLPRELKPEQAEIIRTGVGVFMSVIMVLVAVFTLGIAVVMVVLLTRPRVVAYCKRGTPVGPPPLNG